MPVKITFNKYFILSFFLLFGLSAKPQKKEAEAQKYGLENVIVEKYYISGPNDTIQPRVSGYLPIGSTTYRIFLDMLPEYRFYAAYGLKKHALKLNTSTFFFNNEEIGCKMPNVIPHRTMNNNTVMLDSWLSAGAAGETYYGVLKTDDDSIGTILHQKKFLQNKNKEAGIPITERDGLVFAEKLPFPVFFGIDNLVTVFDNQKVGKSFETNDGAWGCLGGAVGLDSLGTNRLLIAQITTDGDFSFELNLQLGKRGHAPELYVAKEPLAGEIFMPCLTYDSKKLKGNTPKSDIGVQKNKTNPQTQNK
jgi:hypothetical protein